MQQYVTLSIDGVPVRAPKGSSVLDAALNHGICIPHLCHVPTLSDTGACRLCIVEHVRNGWGKVTASCTLTVQEGMVILSNSEKVKKLRRNIAELLVAQAPNSRAVQDIAVRCGVKEVRYPFRNENCIQCGRCVRYCKEIWRADAIGFLGRGKNRRVDFPFGVKPEFCKNCGSCTLYCPMSVTPCEGPMKRGQERLCGKCESQLSLAENVPGACVRCELGKGFQCARHTA
ncbi:MAG: 2Fe-2S iron-sulfur cluster-binding protein [Syntrophales bacterium]